MNSTVGIDSITTKIPSIPSLCLLFSQPPATMKLDKPK